MQVWRHEPETRRLRRWLGHRTRATLMHCFVPESMTLTQQLNNVSNIAFVPPREWQDAFAELMRRPAPIIEVHDRPPLSGTRKGG